MIPQTFEQWKNCITDDCKVSLTNEFVLSRLSVYLNNENPETKKFISLYGNQHYHNIVSWLKLASKPGFQKDAEPSVNR